MIQKTLELKKAVEVFQEAKCHQCGEDLMWNATDDYYSEGLAFQATCCNFAHIIFPKVTEYEYTLREDPYEP